MTPLTEATASLSLVDQAEQQSASPDHTDANLWQSSMLRGDFEQAWQASDRIRARKMPDPHRFWSGESITGKDIIVRSLHGLGDAVQMFRYAPQLNSLARSVTWQVPPNLLELALCFQGVDDVISWEEPCNWQVQVEITELPYLFRTALPQLPVATGYLSMPPRTAEARKPRIGLVWAAGDWNQARSIPLAAFDSILRIGHYEFVSLQGASNPASDPRLTPIASGLLCLAQTIAGLDLVITVDTLAAHLAGALNIPAYVLLQHAADWRWMTEREDSPWYPSLRLFRQPRPGDWATPLQAVHAALTTLKP